MSPPLAHVAGIPVEETVLALAPAGAAMVCVVAMQCRAKLAEVARWRRRR